MGEWYKHKTKYKTFCGISFEINFPMSQLRALAEWKNINKMVFVKEEQGGVLLSCASSCINSMGFLGVSFEFWHMATINLKPFEDSLKISEICSKNKKSLSSFRKSISLWHPSQSNPINIFHCRRSWLKELLFYFASLSHTLRCDDICLSSHTLCSNRSTPFLVGISGTSCEDKFAAFFFARVEIAKRSISKASRVREFKLFFCAFLSAHVNRGV